MRERESKSQAWWGDEAVCLWKGVMQMRDEENKDRRMAKGKEWEKERNERI